MARLQRGRVLLEATFSRHDVQGQGPLCGCRGRRRRGGVVTGPAAGGCGPPQSSPGYPAAALGVGWHTRHVAADDLDQLEAERPDDAEQPLRDVLVRDVAVATWVALDQLARERTGEPGQIGGFGRHGAAPSLVLKTAPTRA